MRWWPILFTLWLAGCGQMSGYHARDGSVSSASQTMSPLVESAPQQAKRERGCDSARYTVRQDDTLGHIALRCGVRVSALARANRLKSPYVIYPGQVLLVPRSTSSPAISATSSRPAHVAKAPLDWQWPTAQTARFGYVVDSSGLRGLEVYLDEGEQVVAVAAGEVVYAENSISNFGLMVIIRHEQDYLTVYAHNSRLVVAKGDQVKAGQAIAYSGRSGTTERAKLYFEARHQGRKIHADRLWPNRR